MRTPADRPPGLNRLALSATLHCLTGCSIGEVLGMAIGTFWRLGNAPTVALAVVLAFLFGYALTALPLLRSGMPGRTALKLAFASDTVSITIMELVDNAVMLLIPGAMDAHPLSSHFWLSMLAALALAGAAAYPVNRFLIARGTVHAHAHRRRDAGADTHEPARHTHPRH